MLVESGLLVALGLVHPAIDGRAWRSGLKVEPTLLILANTREATMGTELRHRGPVQLRFDGGKVVVTPEDQDRFVLAADRAVEACQMMNAGLQLRQRFAEEFLARIFQWCQEHADRVNDCYVAMRDGTLTV